MKLFKSDREFSNDVWDQQNMVVVQHNDLITKAKYDLSSNEIKVMDFIISKIKPDDKDFEIIHSSLYEISGVLGLSRSGRTYNQLTRTLRNLRQKEVIIFNKNNDEATVTGWLNEFNVSKTGKVRAKLSTSLAPYLLELKNKGNYTQHILRDTVQLSGKYAIRLYKLMRESDKNYGKKTPYIQYTPKELSFLMGAPKSYDSWGRLNDKVVKIAIEEINLKIDDMQLELHTEKKGRSVVLVKIYNTFYPIRNRTATQDDVPMVNWLEEDGIQ